MERNMIRAKGGGTVKLSAGWSGALESVMYEAACGYFEAGTGEGFLARGPT